MHVSVYKENTPKLILEEFFKGQLSASGILKDRKGLVTRYFNVDIQASWEGKVGTLVEDFVFDDGEKQQRIWTLTKISESKYEASAADVKRKTIIDVAGNSMFMKYVLIVPYKDSTIDITIDDRMYLVNEHTLINESNMTKFGFNVGEINLVIQHVNH
ncbi:hypothetical protein TYM08_P3087 [Marinicellulosiphila megalodicopiae]